MAPDKGKEGGECNRTACKSSPAICYNPHTLAYYCIGCAMEINVWLEKDGLKLIDIPALYPV